MKTGGLVSFFEVGKELGSGGSTMKLFFILFSFFLAACSFAKDRVTDHAVLYHNDLSLIDRNGTCVIRSVAPGKTTEISLRIKPPCYFVRHKGEKEPLRFTYPHRDADFVVIMFGTPLSDDERKMFDIKEGRICGSATQGLIIHNNAVRVSKKILDGGHTCTDGGKDEKNFWYFAEHS